MARWWSVPIISELVTLRFTLGRSSSPNGRGALPNRDFPLALTLDLTTTLRILRCPPNPYFLPSFPAHDPRTAWHTTLFPAVQSALTVPYHTCPTNGFHSFVVIDFDFLLSTEHNENHHKQTSSSIPHPKRPEKPPTSWLPSCPVSRSSSPYWPHIVSPRLSPITDSPKN